MWRDYTGFQFSPLLLDGTPLFTVSPVEITASVFLRRRRLTIYNTQSRGNGDGQLYRQLCKKTTKKRVTVGLKTKLTQRRPSTSRQKVAPPFKIWFIWIKRRRRRRAPHWFSSNKSPSSLRWLHSTVRL